MENTDIKNKLPTLREAEPKVRTSKVESGKLLLLVTVVDSEKGDSYADMIQAYDVNMQMLVMGEGTANAQTLSLLGLDARAKTVIFSVIKRERKAEILSALEAKFNSIKRGKGVAYTVPLSSVIGVLAYVFLSNNSMTVKEEK